MNTKPTRETEAINIVFKMCGDGRMYEEEAELILDFIFLGQMDDQFFNFLRFIYKARPFDDLETSEELQSIPIRDSRNNCQGPEINIVKKEKGELTIEITIEGFDK